MAGTKLGGMKAAATMRAKYGDDIHAKIGALGGKNGNTGGFASKKIGKDGMTGSDRASVYGAIGGRKSTRKKY